MTSRQPGTSRAESRGRAGNQGAGAAPDWLLVLPLALLIILGLAGLRGAVARPAWNGPLHDDGVAIGAALEVVLGILLVITIRRRSTGRKAKTANAVAVKLREALIVTISAGMVAVAVVALLGLRLHLFSLRTQKASAGPLPKATHPLPKVPPQSGQSAAFHIPAAALLYALLVAVILAGVGLSIWWARRLRPPVGAREDDFIAEDSEDLREAVESGRSALRAVDDARAAIIACYVAMEGNLAERGAARAVADTPDELLARATKSGVVRGGAAARLTALFYEARFSSHQLGRGQRDAAEQALNELAAGLADSGPAMASTPGADA